MQSNQEPEQDDSWTFRHPLGSSIGNSSPGKFTECCHFCVMLKPFKVLLSLLFVPVVLYFLFFKFGLAEKGAGDGLN